MFINTIYIEWEKIHPESYLREIEALKRTNVIELNSPLTFFVGENGSGKSTLLEAIAIADGFNPEGGSRNYSFSTHDSHSDLCDAVTLSRREKAKWGYFLRAESFYNVATQEEKYEDPLHSLRLHDQSHGESFLSVIQNNFNSKGLYILDEPEAALSPQRQLTLMYEIYRSIREGSQFIIATHSPILLGMPDAAILNFGPEGITGCEYEETDSYKITSMFVNNREQILKHLLD